MRPPRVLLAEDDPDVRRLMGTTLRMDGYSVIEARDGSELLDHLGSALLFGNMRGEVDPLALIISDIRMPGHSGLEVLAGMREADVDVAVILVTAHDDPETREEARRLGADAIVHKPFDLDVFRATVRDFAPISSEPEAPTCWRTR